ncbi:hypothetical protein HBB16_02920 [Pseudonocardia sp. MCCB 268]|nr:hypothetical protein [Pseudonocardia cytotoxica]
MQAGVGKRGGADRTGWPRRRWPRCGWNGWGHACSGTRRRPGRVADRRRYAAAPAGSARPEQPVTSITPARGNRHVHHHPARPWLWHVPLTGPIDPRRLRAAAPTPVAGRVAALRPGLRGRVVSAAGEGPWGRGDGTGGRAGPGGSGVVSRARASTAVDVLTGAAAALRPWFAFERPGPLIHAHVAFRHWPRPGPGPMVGTTVVLAELPGNLASAVTLPG